MSVPELSLLPTPEKKTGRRVVGALVGLLVSAGLLLLALYLGAWAYEVRSALIHEKRLATLLEKKPGLDAVSVALLQEGRIETAPGDATKVRLLAEQIAGARAREIAEKSARAEKTRVYTSDDAAYFIYFDRTDTMVGFTLVIRPWRFSERP